MGAIYRNWSECPISNFTAKSRGWTRCWRICYALWHNKHLIPVANGKIPSTILSCCGFLQPLPAYSAKLLGRGEQRILIAFAELQIKTGTAPAQKIIQRFDSIGKEAPKYTLTSQWNRTPVEMAMITEMKNVEQVSSDTGKAAA